MGSRRFGGVVSRDMPVVAVFLLVMSVVPSLNAARYMENLNRGVVAVRVNASSVYVGWRMFGTDPAGISFNVYRGGVKVNPAPITASTNYTDNTTANSTYYIRPVIGGIEQAQSETAALWAVQYKTIPIIQPPMQTMPDGTTCTSTANDCSTGDLDGDGEYEIILKWDTTNSKDNSQSGYTGNTFLDAYKLNGTRLWSIDLGKNIRSGAHYTQFQVYDLNSDGKAEVVCKTAPNTKDSSGAYLSMGPAATDNDATDYRNTSGYILSGPEYLTLFNGQTGREAATINYTPARGTVSSWGDNYGNRVDRFLACVAYLDGVHPSVVMCRGYYTRAVLAAYDWNGTVLSQRWVFDSNTAGNGAYVGEGNHNLSVGDVDGDGKDEIIYGSCSINDNGAGLYATGKGHGDAGHLGNMNPDRAGLEWFQPHEEFPQAAGAELRDPANGNLLWGYPNTSDTGRGLAADIDGAYRGWEMWASNTDGVYNVNGTRISTSKPSVNFRVYWDGDLQDELLDGTKLDKWTGAGTTRLYTFYNFRSSQEINGTKANPCLSADLLGDWREEVVYRNSNNQELNIFTTTTSTNYRFYTLMHDFQYRVSVAWQNTAYNQPPHVSFYLGDGPSAQPAVSIIYPGVTPSPSPIAYSPSVTQTRTQTRTATGTLTRTPSFTATRTYTPSFTISSTATVFLQSPTPFTPSTTASFTATVIIPSATITQTITQSPENTFTNTATLTATMSSTLVSTPTQTPLPAGHSELQVEDACSYDGIFENIHAGYTGTGYANLDNLTGSSVMFFVDALSAQSIVMTYRFANGSTANRDMMIMVNGVVQAANLIFPPTGAWTTWNDAVVSVDLNAGRNEITIEALTTGGAPNMDRVSFVSADVGIAPCVALATPTQIETDTPVETGTLTETITLTETSTEIETNTPTYTATQEAPSETFTQTQTAVITATQTITRTNTQLATGTSTATRTLTITVPTNTPTSTATVIAPSATATRTTTRTITPSLTATVMVPSVTLTQMPVNTATLTWTATVVTPTPTVVPAQDDKFEIKETTAYPNPYSAGQPLNLSFNLSQGSNATTFRLYTSSFRLIRKHDLGVFTAGIKAAQVPAEKLANLGSGTYYFYIEGINAENKKARSRTTVLIVMKYE